MEAIVLAGGMGSRLRPRISGIPKPMAPVAGRPFLEILLNHLAESGFQRLLLSVGYLSDAIRDHFGYHWHNMEIDYVTEHTPLGTGGAIRRALKQIAGSSAFVLNGDTWLTLDYRHMHAAHLASQVDLTLALSHVNDMARFGGVDLHEDRITGFVEKGRTGAGWINGGVYVLSSHFPWPSGLEEKFSFETDLLFPHITAIRHSVYRTNGFFLDIGVPEDLDRANEIWSHSPDR